MTDLMGKIGTLVLTAPTSISDLSTRSMRIVPDAIAGIDLRKREADAIADLVGFDTCERIEIIYKHRGHFEAHFDPRDGVLVGITNARIFSINRGIVTYARIGDMAYCEHRHCNAFRWDYVVVHLQDGRKMEFAINFADTAAHFTKYISARLSAAVAHK